MVPYHGPYSHREWTRAAEFTYTELKEEIAKQYDVVEYIPLEQWDLACSSEERKEKFGYLESDCVIEIKAVQGTSFSVSAENVSSASVYCLSFDWDVIHLVGWRGNGDYVGEIEINEGVGLTWSSESLLYNINSPGSDLIINDDTVHISIGEDVSLEFHNMREAVKNTQMLNESLAQQFGKFFPQIDEMLYGE